MSSITFQELQNRNLSIPSGVNELTIANAAKAYAKSGWYIIPIIPKSKDPGSYFGRGWPDKSTKDLDELDRIFSKQELGIALHVGKSGAVAIDVDSPEFLPEFLKEELFKDSVPFQSTRLVGDLNRGHYLFASPAGISFGNAVGGLGKGWGDVRGQNGVIVVAPSQHVSDGQYRWQRTGTLPLIPDVISSRLITAKRYETAADFVHASHFITAHSANNFPEKFEQRVRWLEFEIKKGESRHSAFLSFICTSLKDSAVGLYPASEALNKAQSLFNLYKPVEEQSTKEFQGMVLWAISQIEAMTLDELALFALQAAPHLDHQLMEWIKTHG